MRSVETVVKAMSDSHVVKYFVPFVKNLSSKEWFTARVSASGLFHLAYSRLPDNFANQFRAKFLALCLDESPVVRRNAAQHFGKMTKVCKPAEVLSEFISVFISLANDEQDSVRIQVLPNCVALANVLPKETQVFDLFSSNLKVFILYRPLV